MVVYKACKLEQVKLIKDQLLSFYVSKKIQDIQLFVPIIDELPAINFNEVVPKLFITNIIKIEIEAPNEFEMSVEQLASLFVNKDTMDCLLEVMNLTINDNTDLLQKQIKLCDTLLI